MPNVADTPTSGELLDADEEGRQIVKDLCQHLDAFASAGRSLEIRSRGLRGVYLFRLMAGSAQFFRGLHDTTGEYLRTIEKFTGGGTAITIRDLAAAPPERRQRNTGAVISRVVAGASACALTLSEYHVLPEWIRLPAALIGLVAAGASPGIFRAEK